MERSWKESAQLLVSFSSLLSSSGTLNRIRRRTLIKLGWTTLRGHRPRPSVTCWTPSLRSRCDWAVLAPLLDSGSNARTLVPLPAKRRRHCSVPWEFPFDSCWILKRCRRRGTMDECEKIDNTLLQLEYELLCLSFSINLLPSFLSPVPLCSEGGGGGER